MPSPDSRGKDMLRVLHQLHLAIAAQADKHYAIRLNQFEREVGHGRMSEAAALANKVLRACGKSPWSIIAHTDECDAPPPGYARQGDAAHVCGFWAVRLSEQKESTSAVKLPFLFNSMAPEWTWDFATTVIDLFVDSGSHFTWDPEAAKAATRAAHRAEKGISQ